MNAPEATVEEVVAAMWWWLSAVCLATPACAFLLAQCRSFVRGSFVRSPSAQAFQA
jgi:hypothetical protein